MFTQKEQRFQERISLLSNHYGGENNLKIVRSLQEGLDKIRALTKPIYTHKIRDFPDFQPLKNDRLEVTYVDFVTFLAKQAINYMNKLEEIDPDEEPRYQMEEDEDINRPYSPQLYNQSPYPSVTNLIGHDSSRVNFKDIQNASHSNLKKSNSVLSITDTDIQKAIRIQNEFQRQHELLLREFSPDKMQMKENINANMRSESRQDHESHILSQRTASRRSINPEVKETIRSQRNLTFDEGAKFVTLSQDNFGENFMETQNSNVQGVNIRSLQMSAKITPRSNSIFKSKFGHLIKKRKI